MATPCRSPSPKGPGSSHERPPVLRAAPTRHPTPGSRHRDNPRAIQQSVQPSVRPVQHVRRVLQAAPAPEPNSNPRDNP
ncbi:hypothetical protein NDU88_006089 [Pleurodeles waltl]|uniref:Uncharacterized protein n=1 Tax=Pleurodeles waltl TaxID=8319 RepID=A0AAV7RQV6_PLEWA|nr:hypothetical protein NDU88_006089 [Pleurodeles waltl]